jgi:hypothetical protein
MVHARPCIPRGTVVRAPAPADGTWRRRQRLHGDADRDCPR